MTIVNREGHNVPDGLGAADEHAKAIEAHSPSTVWLGSGLAQVQEPLDGTHVHSPSFHLGVELFSAPLAHGAPEELVDPGAEQVEGEALP